MAKRIFTVLFVSVLSAAYLSVGVSPPGDRKLASCADPVAEANLLPLAGDLFGQIQDEALRKSTMDYYLFLSRVEMQALAGRQSMRAMYGVRDLAPVSVLPTFAAFDPKAGAFATSSPWGNMAFEGQAQNTFSVGNAIGSVGSSPSIADPAVKAPAGMLFAPSNPATTQRLTQSPAMGIFFRSVNAPNHKIGTF